MCKRRSAAVGWLSYLLDLGFLRGQRLIDLLDQLVRQLLHLGRVLVVVVLAHLAVLVELLEQFHAVAPHVAHRHPGALGILVRNLDELLATFGVERWDRQADERAVGDRIEPEIGFAYRLLHCTHLPLVPDLHGYGTGIGCRYSPHLIDRHALSVDIDDDRIEQMHARPAGAQPRELLLERFDGPAHAALELLQIELAGGHATLP